jgi:hypothetical protein
MSTTSTRRVLATTPVLSVLIVIAIAGALATTNIEWLLRGSFATVAVGLVVGAASTLGVSGWYAAAAVALFLGCYIRWRDSGQHSPILLSLALLTSVLILDDFFHGELVWRYLAAGGELVYLLWP